jgi:hypothetical protein
MQLCVTVSGQPIVEVVTDFIPCVGDKKVRVLFVINVAIDNRL